MKVLREPTVRAGEGRARSRRPLALLAAATTALLLSACGGGGQVQEFKPTRMLAFGDETSMMVDSVDTAGNHDGYKYTVNVRTATSGLNCDTSPIFTQMVAIVHGQHFGACRSAGVATSAYVLAKVNAQAGDASTGLAQQMAEVASVTGQALAEGDLATVMIGAHDVLAVYAAYKAGDLSTEAAREQALATALADAKARAGVAAARISDLIATGTRVLVFAVPDMGLSPYALTEQAASPGAAEVITRISTNFNDWLINGIQPADGRYWGLVQSDDVVAAMERRPSLYLSSPANATVGACDATKVSDLSQCTTTTLVTGGTQSNYLWADATHLGPIAHYQIGLRAQSILRNLPF